MKRVLLARGSWTSYTTHVKGFGSSYTSIYEIGEERLKVALGKGGCQMDFLPNHLASEEFPSTMEEVKEYDCIILPNVGANMLLLPVPTFTRSRKMPNRAKLIRDYVLEGGSPIIVGDYLTFSGMDARGKWHGTAVQEVLSVEVLTMDDRMGYCEEIKPQTVREHEALSGIPEDWSEVLDCNRTIPREDAVMAVEVEGDPLATLGSYGKGGSAMFTTGCAPHWAPPEFCEQEHHDEIWQGIADWLTTK